jgi:SAM-dependent methyltransferase
VLHRLASRASARSRATKFDLFLRELQPTPETTVLDLGVTDTGAGEGAYASDNFFEALYPWPERVTAVGVTSLERFAAAFPRVTAVTADGRDLPFPDGCFDVGFSNAVVEHVGRRPDQERFVAELCRVAKRVYVTTPNRWFPVEVHTLLPLVHWLPRGPRDTMFAALGRPEAQELELLGPRELVSLFPASTPVRLVRRGMTLVAVGGAAPGAAGAAAATTRPAGALP